MRDEMRELYSGLDLQAPGMPKAGPDELNPPKGAFLVGYEAGVATCCGGIKRLDDETARILLEALEEKARELGYVTARLDTGPKQSGAQHLYESAGYAVIPNFNANPVATFFGEKRL